LEHDTAGDPITGLKWTRKTTEKIAEVLQQIDIPVSANTVSRLLYQMHFSLRVNRKHRHQLQSLPRSAIPAHLLAPDSLSAAGSSRH
jgi:Rhodopirellula transposase DDE domain